MVPTDWRHQPDLCLKLWDFGHCQLEYWAVSCEMGLSHYPAQLLKFQLKLLNLAWPTVALNLSIAVHVMLNFLNHVLWYALART